MIRNVKKSLTMKNNNLYPCYKCVYDTINAEGRWYMCIKATPSMCGCWIILKLRKFSYNIITQNESAVFWRSYLFKSTQPARTVRIVVDKLEFIPTWAGVPERNKRVSASLHETQFVYDWTALISCLCPPAGSQAVTIDSMSCEVISSSSSAAHAVRQKDDCTVIILAIISLLLFLFL